MKDQGHRPSQGGSYAEAGTEVEAMGDSVTGTVSGLDI